MARAIAVVTAGSGHRAPVRDTLLLSHHERRAPGGTVVALRGTVIDIGLPAGTRLGHEDRLLLDDGSAVEVVARPEPLLEVRTADLATLARAAWLLGDHHIPVEIHARYLRVTRTESASAMLRALEVTLREIEAPFEPEGGAYDHASYHHENDAGA
jgi:urease accessory protein